MTNTKYMLSGRQQFEPNKAPRALRILIADDDRDTVLTLMMVLRDEGHEVRGVHSGNQVLDAIRDFDPDAVVLDIHLPGKSGWELASTIQGRRSPRRPLLIGISGKYRQGADNRDHRSARRRQEFSCRQAGALLSSSK